MWHYYAGGRHTLRFMFKGGAMRLLGSQGKPLTLSQPPLTGSQLFWFHQKIGVPNPPPLLSTQSRRFTTCLTLDFVDLPRANAMCKKNGEEIYSSPLSNAPIMIIF